jgi:hypothetical protein
MLDCKIYSGEGLALSDPAFDRRIKVGVEKARERISSAKAEDQGVNFCTGLSTAQVDTSCVAGRKR